MRERYGHDEGVIGVLEGERFLAELDVGALEVGHVEPLVVLLHCCLYHDLLLLGVHLEEVVVLGVGQVADAPLEALQDVPPQEDGLGYQDAILSWSP